LVLEHLFVEVLHLAGNTGLEPVTLLFYAFSL